MFRQGQLAVHGLAILLGRIEAGISNRGKFFLHRPVIGGIKVIVVTYVSTPESNILHKITAITLSTLPHISAKQMRDDMPI